MSVALTIMTCVAALSLAGLIGAGIVIRNLLVQLDDTKLEPIHVVMGEVNEEDRVW